MQELYVLHDITAECYTTPFHASNDAVATRILSNMVNTPGSSISDNPEDFRLYHIASFDEFTGKLHVFPSAEFIIRASDLRLKISFSEG